MKLQDQEPLQGRTRSSSTSSNSTMQQLLFDPFCPHPLIILTGAGRLAVDEDMLLLLLFFGVFAICPAAAAAAVIGFLDSPATHAA